MIYQNVDLNWTTEDYNDEFKDFLDIEIKNDTTSLFEQMKGLNYNSHRKNMKYV